MHYIPGLRLRVPDYIQRVGIDESEIGEFAYDYVRPSSEVRPMVKSLSDSTAYELRGLDRLPL